MATTLREYLDKSGVLSAWAQMKTWVQGYAKITTTGSTSTITIGDSSVTPVTSQDISGKADKSEMSVTTSGDQTTITLKSGTSATVINAHQSLSGKQDTITSSNKLSADLVSDGTTNKAYTSTEKTKLAGIAAGAEVNVNADWDATSGDAEILHKPTIPSKTSDLTNDSGFITAAQVEESIVKSVNTTAGTSGVNLSLSAAGDLDVTISSGSVASNNSNFVTGGTVYTAIQNAKVGAATFQDTVNAPADISSLTNYKKGYYWVVATAGEYVGETCEIGDMIFCVSDYNSQYKASDFSVVQSNLNVASIGNDWITANCI